MAALAGFYRRILPPPSIDFTCPEGKELFREALGHGTMEGFFKLIVHFQTQAEPAFCGLASLAVVLNSLSIDPGRKWKGPWRWFDESMLDCCEPLEKVKVQGISFAKVACLGECSGARVTALRASNSSLGEFRQFVKDCASSENQHMIASYNRQVLKQTGSGHFSPIGGYHEEKDMALILDVARFKYPPHWVPLPLLWDAVNTVDASTGNKRGFMLVTKQEQPPSHLFTLSCRDENWRDVMSYLLRDLPKALGSLQAESLQEIFCTVLESFPGSLTGFVKWIAEVRRAGAQCSLEKGELDRSNDKANLLRDLRCTNLHLQLSKWLESCCPCPLLDKNLEDDVSEACCQGATILNTSGCSTCLPTCIKHQPTDTTTIVTGKDGSIEVLVPMASTSCTSGPSVYPSAVDIFAILLYALPENTWAGVRNLEIGNLVSTFQLPQRLQEEILHLRRQLLLLFSGSEEESWS